MFDIYSPHSTHILTPDLARWLKECVLIFLCFAVQLVFHRARLAILFMCAIMEIIIGDYCHPQVSCKFDV